MKSNPLRKSTAVKGMQVNMFRVLKQRCFPGLFFFLVSFMAAGQKLTNGRYKGIETITLAPDKTAYYPGVFSFGNNTGSTGEKWFHEVFITVKDSLLTIEKKPVTIKDGITTCSDSTGGFYFYEGTLLRVNDSTFTIRGNLVTCAFCPHAATGTPKYIHAFYVIRVHRGNWIVDTAYEKGLLFRKT